MEINGDQDTSADKYRYKSSQRRNVTGEQKKLIRTQRTVGCSDNASRNDGSSQVQDAAASTSQRLPGNFVTETAVPAGRGSIIQTVPDGNTPDEDEVLLNLIIGEGSRTDQSQLEYLFDGQWSPAGPLDYLFDGRWPSDNEEIAGGSLLRMSERDHGTNIQGLNLNVSQSLPVSQQPRAGGQVTENIVQPSMATGAEAENQPEDRFKRGLSLQYILQILPFLEQNKPEEAVGKLLKGNSSNRAREELTYAIKNCKQKLIVAAKKAAIETNTKETNTKKKSKVVLSFNRELGNIISELMEKTIVFDAELQDFTKYCLKISNASLIRNMNRRLEASREGEQINQPLSKWGKLIKEAESAASYVLGIAVDQQSMAGLADGNRTILENFEHLMDLFQKIESGNLIDQVLRDEIVNCFTSGKRDQVREEIQKLTDNDIRNRCQEARGQSETFLLHKMTFCIENKAFRNLARMLFKRPRDIDEEGVRQTINALERKIKENFSFAPENKLKNCYFNLGRVLINTLDDCLLTLFGRNCAQNVQKSRDQSRARATVKPEKAE